MSAFDALLPRDAIVVEANSAIFWDSGLMPEEAHLVSQAVERRKREFTAGRNCARQALAKLGFSPIAIGTGPNREPIFPADVSGSITHTSDYCAAAVIRRGDTLSIGIDAEPAEPLSADVAELILRPEEQRMAASLGVPDLAYDKLVFSTKEAFYKAYFQLAPEYLDFLEASVVIFPYECAFEITVLKTDVDLYFRTSAFRGHYSFDDRRIYSAIALPAPTPPSSRA